MSITTRALLLLFAALGCGGPPNSESSSPVAPNAEIDASTADPPPDSRGLDSARPADAGSTVSVDVPPFQTDGRPPAPDAQGVGSSPDAIPPEQNPLIGIGMARMVPSPVPLVYAEGPTWIAEQGYFVFGDTRLGKAMYKVVLPGTMTLFRTVGYVNGNAVGPGGDLFSAQDGFIMRARGGTIQAPVERLVDIGGTLSGPNPTLGNDLVVASDGTIYVTALRAGGDSPPGRLGVVFMARPPEYKTTIAHRGKVKNPNGIALSPDEKLLYVVDANYTDRVADFTLTHRQSLWRFNVNPDGTLDDGELLINRLPGGMATQPDGMAVDDMGNLFITVEKGIEVHHSSGKRWGSIKVTPDPRNCAFGGPDRRTLLITGRDTVQTIQMRFPGKP